MNYRKLYEKEHSCCLLSNTDIHHIDGDHANNVIQNLTAVSLQDHLDIHYLQGDWGAVQAILIRMDYDLQELKNAASNAQRRRLENGTHNFQRISKERRSEISRSAALKTVVEQKGIHALNANPELARENAKMAGLLSKAKKAGFHDPEKSGSNIVRNTFWWTNTTTGKRKRSAISPGFDWKKGMK